MSGDMAVECTGLVVDQCADKVHHQRGCRSVYGWASKQPEVWGNTVKPQSSTQD